MTDTKELRATARQAKEDILRLLIEFEQRRHNGVEEMTDAAVLEHIERFVVAVDALPGLLDEVDRLTEDNGALADRVALHYEEWHAEGEKRVKAEADLLALAEKERQKDTDLMHALHREDALRADLAALRERMSSSRKDSIRTYTEDLRDDGGIGQFCDVFCLCDELDEIAAILSDDQPATGSHGETLGLNEEQTNRMARGEEPATDTYAVQAGSPAEEAEVCGPKPATEPPTPTQEQTRQNNVWLAAVEARGFCRMLEVDENNVTLSPAYESLLAALRLAGLDVHAEPVTEDTERCVCEPWDKIPCRDDNGVKVCDRCGFPIQVQESDDA